ncbi:MAG: gliding motility-associated C-terminal domain-containing protein [Siphonobacter sp.]
MRTLYRLFGVIAILLCGLAPSAWATHVRAGEITARRTSDQTLTYEVTLTIYCDYQANGGKAATDLQTDVTMCFGDGSAVEVVPLYTTGLSNGGLVDVGNDTRRLMFKTTHTFSAPGTYTISVGIDNRNANTINITNGNSVNYPFYVESTLMINSFLGLNNTPVMLNPPVDFTACVGQRYIHNPNAFDADGDSLAYHITQCKTTQVGESCSGYVVPSFVQPNVVPSCTGTNEAGTASASYSINSTTGDLIWDAPVCAGQYNVAFVIEEWRNGVKIGEITRDMQIIVSDCNNKRPTITVPDDICIEAGTAVNFTVTGTDPDGNTVTISSSGGVYQQSPNGTDQITAPFATFTTPSQPQSSPGTGTFSWQTTCDHIRELAYPVLFKVADNPGSVQPTLIDSKIVNIKVVAPAPTNLKATPSTTGNGFVLTWDAYPCADDDVEIIIYRKEGCTDLTVDLCNPAAPAGYTEVTRVPSTTTTYTDTSATFSETSQYSYRIAAHFYGANNLTEFTSTFSDQACEAIKPSILYITNVTVDSTHITQGQITVKWMRPIGAGSTYTGDYQYRLYRTTGLNGTGFTQIASINTNLSNISGDTIYVDSGLNTETYPYRYRLALYTTGGVFVDSSAAASSVWLTGSAQSQAIQLTWQANVPWNNNNQTHRIYRVDNQTNQYNLIKELTVSGSFQYTDDGTDAYTADGDISTTLSTDSTYCYRVLTVGRYNNTSIQTDLLYNYSQRLCLSPSDTTKPCAPVLTLDPLDCTTYIQGECESAPYSNTLTWTEPTTQSNGQTCDPYIIQYNVYYKRYEESDDFTLVGTVEAPTQTFLHDTLSSYAGCYYVTAINRFGIESNPSNIVCKDNCPDILLPNVITPNGDGKNDTFVPMNCPRFVKSIHFTVYNRWGVKIFERSDDPQIHWDGRTKDGKLVSAGTYYYEAQVYYQRLNQATESKPTAYKGWIQVIR